MQATVFNGAADYAAQLQTSAGTRLIYIYIYIYIYVYMRTLTCVRVPLFRAV